MHKTNRFFLVACILATGLLPFCTSSKKATAPAKPAITYKANIEPVMMANCAPCHFPPKGNKKPYDTYTAVKDDVDEILERIQKNPGEKGFMPLRHARLSDSTIQVFKDWKEGGAVEAVAGK